MILITAPTGDIGSQVLHGLLQNTDEQLRVIVRDAAKLSTEARERVDVVRMAPVDGSSTEIQHRLGRGQTIAPYVPQAILAYIEEKGLYQS